MCNLVPRSVCGVAFVKPDQSRREVLSTQLKTAEKICVQFFSEMANFRAFLGCGTNYGKGCTLENFVSVLPLLFKSIY